MASSSNFQKEGKKPAVNADNVLFAMMDDLGVGRLERLVEDEEGGRRRTASERPIQRQSDRSHFNDPGAKAFNDAIAGGEFQDEDFEGVRTLANIADGNLHRGVATRRRPAPAPAPPATTHPPQAGPPTTAGGPSTTARGRSATKTGPPATAKGSPATSGAGRAKSPYDPQHPTIYRPSSNGRVNKPVHTSNSQVTSLGVLREPGVPVKRFEPPKKVPANSSGTGVTGAPRTPLGTKTNGAEAPTGGSGAARGSATAEGSRAPLVSKPNGASVVQGRPSNATGSAIADRPVTKAGPAQATVALLPHERAILMEKTPKTQGSHNAISAKSPESEISSGFPTHRVADEKHTPASGVVEEDASELTEGAPFHEVKKPVSYRAKNPIPVKTFNSFNALSSEGEETLTSPTVEQKSAAQDTNVVKSTKSEVATGQLTHHDEEKRSVQSTSRDATGSVKSAKLEVMFDLLTDQPVDEKRNPAHHHAAETRSSAETSPAIKLIDIDEAKQAASQQNSNKRYLEYLRELGQMESFSAQPSLVQPSVPARPPTGQFSQSVLELVYGFPAEYYKSITLLTPSFDEFLAESNVSPPRGMTRSGYAARRLAQMHLSTLDGYDSLDFKEKQSATDIVFGTVMQKDRRITRTVNDMLAMEDCNIACPVEVKEFNEMVRTGKYDKKKPIRKTNTRGTSYASTTTVAITPVEIEKPVDQSATREFEAVTTTASTTRAQVGKPIGQTTTRGALDTITKTANTTLVEVEKLDTKVTADKIDRPLCGWDLL